MIHPTLSSTSFASLPGLALILLVACGAPPDQGTAVARVGDAVLTETELAAQLPADLEGKSGAAEKALFVENWIREELLYQEALDLELDQKAHLQHLLEQARRSLLVATLLDEAFDGQEAQISEAEIQEYYDQHQDEFLLLQPQVHARHILVATRRDANARLQALKRGEPFEKIAREYSLDPDTKFAGGDLGYFSEDDDPLLWETCQNLPLNRLSKPIRTEYGHHIIEVLDRQEAGTAPELEQVRSQIVETLVHQQYQQRLEKLIDRLKTSREWTVYDESLKGSL